MFYIFIYFYIFFCNGKAEFSEAITLVFNVTWGDSLLHIKYYCIMKACYFSSVGREMRLYACDESQLLDKQCNHLPGQFHLARIFAHSGHTTSDQGRW